MATALEYKKYVTKNRQLGMVSVKGMTFQNSWCREANWLPCWGEKTKKRANLMKELRNYWLNKWFSKIVPEIKKTLIETTPIPEDVINFLPEYFEYPYQTKLW